MLLDAKNQAHGLRSGDASESLWRASSLLQMPDMRALRRWVTVLKNAEQVDSKGTTKQPRLGSFEVELLWM